jgi:hypothetical protein
MLHPMTTPLKPARGSLRVQGWLYTVINPLIDACERDLRLLHAGNLTWKRGVGTEGVRAARDHLHGGGPLNAEDLLAFHGELAGLFAAQEAAVRELREAASLAFEALLRNPHFRRSVTSAARKLLRSAADDDGIIGVLAEHVVNNGDRHGGTHAEIWQTLEPELPWILREPPFERLTTARAGLVHHSAALLDALRATRQRLCEDFDLPPGPVPIHVIHDRR